MGWGDSDVLKRVEEKLDLLLKIQQEEISALREDLLAAASPQAYALRHRSKVTTDTVAAELAKPKPQTGPAIRRSLYKPEPS